MRILVFNWNEALIHSLYKLGHSFDVVGTCVLGRSRPDGISTWNFAVRPLLETMKLVVNPGALHEDLKNGAYDLAICLDLADLEFLKEFSIPKIFCPLVSLKQKMGEHFDDADALEEAYHKLTDNAAQTIAAYLSDTLGDPSQGGYPLQGETISRIICADADGYGGYNGSQAVVIRTGNQLSQQPNIDFALQQTVLDGLPQLTLGINPDIPGSEPPKSWDNFKTQLRMNRVYFATPTADAQSPELLNILEAMLIGIPVVTTPHPLGLIEDGVTGFVASDAQTLRQRLEELLQNHDLATKLGLDAKKAALERFVFDDYLDGWEDAIQKCINNAAAKTNSHTDEISLPPMMGSLDSEEEDEDSEPATEIHESPEAYAQEISLPPEEADTKITNRPFDDDLEEPSTVELTIASDASNHEHVVHTPPSTMLGQPIGEAAGLAKTVLLPEDIDDDDPKTDDAIRIVSTEEVERGQKILESSEIVESSENSPAFAPTKKIPTAFRIQLQNTPEAGEPETEINEADQELEDEPQTPADSEEEIAEESNPDDESGVDHDSVLAVENPEDIPKTKSEIFARAAQLTSEESADADLSYMEDGSTVDMYARDILASQEETAELPRTLVTGDEDANASVGSTTRRVIPAAMTRPLNLLFVTHTFSPDASPMDQVLYRILQMLIEQGDTCNILFPGSAQLPASHEEPGPVSHVIEKPEDVRHHIETLNPDIVFTHKDLAPFTGNVCHEMHKPCVILVSDYQHFGPNPASIDSFNYPYTRQYYGSYRRVMDDHSNLLRRASEVLCTSGHLAGLVRHAYNRAARVWPLPIEVDNAFEPTASSYRKHLVMDAQSNPSGVRIFVDIVHRMPEATFLMTGLHPEHPDIEEIEEIPNLTVTPAMSIGRGTSISHLATARLFIAPSEWPDPDGYPALQAMACGVPVVVPNLGAYPEAVGEAGLIVRQPRDPIAWVEQISNLLHSRSLYDYFMEQGQARARKLSLPSQMNKLRTVFEMVVARAQAQEA